MTTVAIIQARMGSTRLPGKVARDLMGSTILEHVVRRAKASIGIDKVVVATTVHSRDELIVEICQRNSFDFFRGSEQDVLDRYYQAAKLEQAEVVVRITSDCPLIDPKITEMVIAKFLTEKCDYCSNIINRSFPIGLDVEVMSFAALSQAWKEASEPYQREHVTPYLSDNPGLFVHSELLYSEVVDAQLAETDQQPQLELSKMRWTLDYPEDFQFIEQVYQQLYSKDPLFNMEDVLCLLAENPLLQEINAGIG